MNFWYVISLNHYQYLVRIHETIWVTSVKFKITNAISINHCVIIIINMEKVETKVTPVWELRHKFQFKMDIYKAFKHQSKHASKTTCYFSEALINNI